MKYMKKMQIQVSLKQGDLSLLGIVVAMQTNPLKIKL